MTFNLEEDSEIISYELKVAEHRVEEIMQYMVNLGLFEEADGIITCLKMAKRFDKSMTNSPKMRKWLELQKGENVMTCTDTNSTCAELEENTIQYNTSIKDLSESDDSNATTPTELPKKKRSPAVPYQAILDLYLEILVNTGEPMGLIAVQTLTTARKTKIRQYWSQNGSKGLDGVRNYFQYIWDNRMSHSWIFGCAGRDWKADIAYLMREDTVAKARENTLGNWSNDK